MYHQTVFSVFRVPRPVRRAASLVLCRATETRLQVRDLRPVAYVISGWVELARWKRVKARRNVLGGEHEGEKPSVYGKKEILVVEVVVFHSGFFTTYQRMMYSKYLVLLVNVTLLLPLSTRAFGVVSLRDRTTKTSSSLPMVAAAVTTSDVTGNLNAPKRKSREVREHCKAKDKG